MTYQPPPDDLPPTFVPTPTSTTLPQGTQRRLASWRSDYASLSNGHPVDGLDGRAAALLDEMEALVEALTTVAGTTPPVNKAADDDATAVTGDYLTVQGFVNIHVQLVTLNDEQVTFAQRPQNWEGDGDASPTITMTSDYWRAAGQPLALHVHTPGVQS